ncbi:MAG: hypothetical protein HKN41_11550 [Ilumatobacter sp.]|nr:hypothetical protein [Ilumatobacter sp.]
MRQTAGNPLLVNAVSGNSDHGVAADIDTAVHQRLARLAQPVREALTVAAIVGLEFDLKVVAAALDRDELQLIEELDLAVEARLLENSGGDTYHFAHALVRASLRDAVSSPRRARWHGRIATALELVNAASVDRFEPAIAHHYAEASASNPTLRFVAIEHLRSAARRAADQLSYVEAIELLDWAASLAEPDDLEPLTAIALERGQAEANRGAVRAALDSYDRALDLARRLGRADLVAEAALRFEDASWRPGRYGAPSIARVQEALDLVDDDDISRRARLLVALTRASSMTGDVAAANEAFAAAAPLVARLGEPELEARALGAKFSVYLDAGPPPPLEPVTRLRQLCDHIDDVEAELLARQIHLRYQLRLGRMAEYRQALKEMTAITDDLHSSFWRYIVSNHVAMLALYDGDLRAAELASLATAEAASHLVDDDTTGTLGLRMFIIRREQDRVRQLAPAIDQLVVSGETTTFWTPGLALLLLETGQRERAESLLHELRDHEFDLPVDAMWSTVMVMLIELAARLGDTVSCRILREKFSGQEGSAIVTGHGIVCFGSGDRYLGMLAAALGDDDRAEEHFRAAIEFDDRNGGVLWATHARLHLAGLLRRQQRRDDSDLLRQEVCAVAERRGYRLLERLAGAS